MPDEEGDKLICATFVEIRTGRMTTVKHCCKEVLVVIINE